ncbi:hypothetical protein Bbelb_116790 [Branchiostoma belcheri]|nr:hypothetical protein Bbelb_116790 [Branchiostoma belcheri]
MKEPPLRDGPPASTPSFHAGPVPSPTPMMQIRSGNDGAEIRFPLGENVFATVGHFRGKPTLSVRHFYRPRPDQEDVWKGGKKGIVLTPEQSRTLKREMSGVSSALLACTFATMPYDATMFSSRRGLAVVTLREFFQRRPEFRRGPDDDPDDLLPAAGRRGLNLSAEQWHALEAHNTASAGANLTLAAENVDRSARGCRRPNKDYEIVSPECGELRILRYNSRRHDSTSMIFGRHITAVEAEVKYKFRLREGSVRHEFITRGQLAQHEKGKDRQKTKFERIQQKKTTSAADSDPNWRSNSSEPKTTTQAKERAALKDLATNQDILILPANKGRCTVVLDREQYDRKVQDLLGNKDTYMPLKKDPTNKFKVKISTALRKLQNEGVLDRATYLKLNPTTEQSPAFYGLPEVHKQSVPLRPIVSSIGSVTYELPGFLAKILGPLIKDIRVEDDETITSYDVCSLFTSIPPKEAVSVVREALEADNTCR